MTTSTIKQRRRFSQGHSARPRRPDVVLVSRTPPLMQLTIYPTHVERRTRHGQRWTSDLVAPAAIAQILSNAPATSGLLPPFTLATGRVNGKPYLVQWRPPRVATLQALDELHTIPLPPLIFAGCGNDYRIWALGSADYPTRTDLPLCVAPFPNCYSDGRICWGNVNVAPFEQPKHLAAAQRLFLEESRFNLHLAEHKSLAFPRSVIANWQQIHTSGASAYPLDDLLPAQCMLGWLLDGGPWGGKQ